MAKKRQRDPSDCVHDTYRRVNGGVVDIPVNSKDGTSNYYVDRSRLATETRYDEASGSFVEGPADILRNAKRGMGGLKFPSSNKRG